MTNAITCNASNIINRAKAMKSSGNSTNKDMILMLYSLYSMTQGMAVGERYDLDRKDGFDGLLQKMTGDSTMTFSKAINSENDALKPLLDMEIMAGTIAAISMKKSPVEFRKEIMNLDVMDNNDFSRDSVNRIVSVYAREYGRVKGSRMFDKVGSVASYLITLGGNLTAYRNSIFSNINKVYDRNLKSSVIYNDSAEIINGTEIIFGRLSSAFHSMKLKTNENKYVTMDMINKYFYLMDKQYSNAKGPHEEPDYEKLRNTLQGIIPGSNDDKAIIDTAMSEMIAFKKSFDEYNYGLKSGERIWFDNNTEKYMVYKVGLRDVPPEEYKVENRAGSYLWYVNQLGKKVASSIMLNRDVNSLSKVERQMLESFDEKKCIEFNKRGAGLYFKGHKVRLDYVPIDKKDEGIVDLSGTFNNSLIADIPRLSFLQERKVLWNTGVEQGDFIDKFTHELSMVKMVFSQLGQFELTKNTRALLTDTDFIKQSGLTPHEISVMTEVCQANEASFIKKDKQKDMITMGLIKGLGAIQTLHVTRILGSPKSAISNVVGGRLSALLNQSKLNTLQYSNARKAWQDKEKLPSVLRVEIDKRIDGLMNPYSRQEAAIHNDTELAGLQKFESIVQKLADSTADYGMFSLPDMIVKGVLGVEKFEWAKKIGLRNSERILRGDYWKGVVSQLAQAKLELAGKMHPTERDMIEAIDEVADQYKGIIGMMERRIHGDFSSTAKSPMQRFGLMDADNALQVIKGFAISSILMFKNVEFFSIDSFVSSLVGSGYAFKESGKADDLMYGSIFSLGIIAANALANFGLVPLPPVVSSVNPIGTPMTMAEISAMFVAFSMNGKIDDEEWKQIETKLIRLGGGVNFGPTLMAQLRELGSNEPNLTNWANTMVAINDPLRAMMAMSTAMGITTSTEKASEMSKERSQARNTVATTPLVGDLASRYTYRLGEVIGASKAIMSGDIKGAGEGIGSWLFGTELGFRFDTDKLFWGLVKNDAIKSKLSTFRNATDLSLDEIKILTGGI